MARITKIELYLQNHSADSMMVAWNAGGETRELLILEIGYANEGALYNALRAAGYIDGGSVNTGTRNATPKAGKVKGCLPFKTANAIARVLNIDPEIDDIGWTEFQQALSQQVEPENWLGLLFHRLGGTESEGGKAFQDWIDSNRAIDAAAAAAAERAADPTIQLKENMKKLNRLLDEREREIEDLKAELLAEKAKPRSNGRVNRGGELTQDMLRLLKQRFHPDKNNGSEELCTSIMQWLNAIEI